MMMDRDLADRLARFVIAGTPEDGDLPIVSYWRCQPMWPSAVVMGAAFEKAGIRFEFEPPAKGRAFEAGHRWPDGTHIVYLWEPDRAAVL